MKKYLILMLLSAAFLAACNENNSEDNGAEDDTSTEEAAEETPADENTEDSAENDEASEEDESAEENGREDVDMSAEGIIDQSVSEYGDTTSYQMTHNYIISQDDEEEEIRMITTRSDQNELKIDVNTPSDTFSHYIIDGEHFVYTNGDFEFQAENEEITGSAYSDILSSLDSFREADFEEAEEGYILTETIEEIDQVLSLLPEDLSSEVSGASAEGTIELLFNENFQFNGSNLELTLESEGDTYTLSSTSEIRGIGTLEVIEKPDAMSE